MEDTLTATIPDPELQKLEVMAVEHDTQASEELSAQPPDPAQPEAEKKTPESEINPDNSETDPEKKGERPRDALGRFTKTESGEDIPENERKPAEEPKPEKPETPYDKAKKEEARAKNLLANFEQEKQKARAEIELAREQLRREAAELQRARHSGAVPNRPANGQIKFSSAELLEAADEFEKQAVQAFDQGDRDTFVKAIETARAARQQAGQVQTMEQQSAQQAQAQRFQQVYVQVMDQTMKAEPDLTKPDSPLSKEVSALLEQEPVFNHMPDGFAKAVQLAKMKMAAASVSELRAKLTKAEAEVQRLTKERTPLGAGPTAPIQPKNFDALSSDEQMKQLERMAEQYDAQAA